MLYIRAVFGTSTKTNPGGRFKFNLDIAGGSFYYVTNFSRRWFIGRSRARFAADIEFEFASPGFGNFLGRLRLFCH